MAARRLTASPLLSMTQAGFTMLTMRMARQDDPAAIAEIHNGTVPARTVTAGTEPVSAASRQAWCEVQLPRAALPGSVERDLLIPGHRLMAD